jgi:hypothetical protein
MSCRLPCGIDSVATVATRREPPGAQGGARNGGKIRRWRWSGRFLFRFIGDEVAAARVQAAAASKDKRTAGAFKVAVAGLHALGLKLDAVCASGDISALDKLMRENRWSAERSINLKAALGVIGAA